ncbi:hypothetical protein BDZ97DRAFT_1840164 [Flammula alnicola]|nr:hypothetical protein BDZ97DRAFT_1840164 [Flammula alnicola]
MDINFVLSSLPHSPPNFQPAPDAIMSPQTIQDFLANGNWSPQPYESESRSVIDWIGDPANDACLLDWIDKHPLEREILFSPTSLQGTRTISKNQCIVRAAKHFFSSDSDPAVRRDLKTEAGRDRLGNLIGTRFFKWKRKYQDFNSEIGPAASNMRYEELLKIGGETRRKFEELLEEFPIWKRLHAYWRTLPEYNLYCSGFSSSPSSSALPSPFGTIRKIMQPPEKGWPGGRNETERSSVFVESKSRDPSESPDSEVIIVNNLPREEKNMNIISKGAFQVFNNFVPGRKTQRNSKRTRQEFEEEDIHSEINNTFADDDTAKGLTAIQKYELQMAEIQLKRQKLELEIQEKKTAAEIRHIEVEAEERRRALDDRRQREKEKHEIMIHFMALVTGSSSKENMVEQLGNT